MESFVNGGSLARIERVENPTIPSTSAASQMTPRNNTNISNNLQANLDSRCNGEAKLLASQRHKAREDDTDSTMDTSDGGAALSHDSGVALSHDSSRSNSIKENGMTPSETSSAPPVCNGHSSDTDSLLTESNAKSTDTGRQSDVKKSSGVMMNGGGDADKGLATPPLHSKNGFINGLEKMIASIPSEKPRHQRQLGT